MIQPIYINKPLRAIVNLDVQVDMPVRAVEVLLCFTFVCVLSFGVRNILLHENRYKLCPIYDIYVFIRRMYYAFVVILFYVWI